MNRLFDIRVTDAKESVDRTKAALTKATNRRADAAAMQMELRKLRLVEPWVSSLGALISYCKKVQEELPSDVRPEFQRNVTEADGALEALQKCLLMLQDRAAHLNNSSFNTDQLKTHERRTTELLQKKKTELDVVRVKAQDQQFTPRELLREIDSAKPFWGEHIETVAGMILRDERFDDGLCFLADRLIEICRGHSPFGMTDTFNILGREHTVLKELTYTLYFRFPSWSVWGLALVAHEFWHASSKGVFEDRVIRSRLEELSGATNLWREPLAQDCLADAFATFVIGPAYAFACVLLLLDVSSPQDRLRAETVFATLDYLAKVKEDAPAYAFAAELKECWNDARGPEVASQPGNAISHPDENVPYPLVEAAQIGILRDAVLGLMPGKLRYNAGSWLSAGESMSGLLEKKADDEQGWAELLKGFAVPDGVDLRHALHAAWWDRWTGGGGDEHQENQAPERIKSLAQRAAQLCHKVVAYRPRPVAVIDDENGPAFGTGMRILSGKG